MKVPKRGGPRFTTLTSPRNSKKRNYMEFKKIEEQLQRIEQLTLFGAKNALTVDDVVIYTGLKKSYIYKLVHLRQIPYYKNAGGGKTYFRKQEIEEWMLHQRVSTQDELAVQAAAYTLNKPINKKGGRYE